MSADKISSGRLATKVELDFTCEAGGSACLRSFSASAQLVCVGRGQGRGEGLGDGLGDALGDILELVREAESGSQSGSLKGASGCGEEAESGSGGCANGGGGDGTRNGATKAVGKEGELEGCAGAFAEVVTRLNHEALARGDVTAAN